jgi:hypothetical protein
MTANELADFVEISKPDDKTHQAIATTLRQQAEKIQQLRIQIANEEESYMLLNEDYLCAKESNKQLTEKIGHLKQIIDANNLQSDIGQLKKELALQKLSDIGQEIETLDTRSYLIGRYDGLEKDELKQLVKSFFEDYLDYQEESDSGRVFNPIHVSCTRVMMIEPLAKLLMRMRELSGVKE